MNRLQSSAARKNAPRSRNNGPRRNLNRRANGQRAQDRRHSAPLGNLRPTAELIAGLNKNLAAEWGTIIRYTYQAAKALGLRGAELREILEKEIPDELGHARFLTDVISDLGGDPTTEPRPWPRVVDLKAMIEQDLELELQDVASYTRHSKMAEQLGLTELKVHHE